MKSPRSTWRRALETVTSCALGSPPRSRHADRDALVTELVAAGVPVAPVLTAREAMAAEVFAGRPVVENGTDGQPGLPLRFS